MKRILNTLYVMTQGSYLSRKGEAVLISVEHETKLHVPIHTLEGIVCFGQITCSPPMLGLCAERGVSVSFLSEWGKFWARIQGPVAGNILLRKAQYRCSDNKAMSVEPARSVVIAKIANCRTAILRAARDSSNTNDIQSLKQASDSLKKILEDMPKQIELDTVRGKEGMAARIYFSVLDLQIKTQKEEFFFKGRTRRPPLDNFNSLLSFYYTLLVHDIRSALDTVGLDPAAGFLHRDRPGRPGLALDLMEELRPYIADRLALALVNRKQLKGTGFQKSETGAVVMNEKARKTVIKAYQNRKQDVINHTFLDEKIHIGLLPHVQAMLMARFLRGDLDGYPPFIWK
ncbi:MAG: type I-C CRISPR-associated endonuclease Cas1 [candidate division Zixibacteria bacterium]|nr:type I-C CRISPR-associated endonuclease Cas1 [candidate division Zixibacteria bacterium]